jgi:hypothetical protein
MKDLKKMNKDALEEYGRTVGIELDRRQSKKKLIKQVEEQITKSGELIDTFTEVLQVVHAEEELSKIHENRPHPPQKVLLRDKNTGHFSRGPQPAGASNGRSGGEPYWEI